MKTKKAQSILLKSIDNFNKKKSFTPHKKVEVKVQVKEASDGSRIFERI